MKTVTLTKTEEDAIGYLYTHMMDSERSHQTRVHAGGSLLRYFAALRQLYCHSEIILEGDDDTEAEPADAAGSEALARE